MTEQSSARHCPSCGAVASGRFCASCGAALDAAACGACGTGLAPGASFCHRCGTPLGARAARPAAPDPGARGLAASLPWVVAGIALLALIGLVAAQRITTARSGPFAGQPGGAPFAGQQGAARPTDISQLDPREITSRLYDRVMRLHAEEKSDSVAFFANMAIQAYREMFDSLDADQRFDFGRIAEVSGAYPLARAQADTLLQEQPRHLLGLILAARLAAASGDTRAQREFERRLLEAESTELQRGLPEYQAHEREIQNAIAEARRRG